MFTIIRVFKSRRISEESSMHWEEGDMNADRDYVGKFERKTT
jgi:hypothetical protein